jgi:tetratricopeptide (TPR) repeat protein
MRPFFIIMMALWALVSCSREKEEPAVPVSTEKNLFEELREQTIKNPRDADAWFHLADVYERSEMYREEVDALQKVIAIDSKRATAYAKLGSAYNRLGQYQDAVKQLTIATKLTPKNAVIYNNLAVSYGKLGKIDEEIASLKKAIALRPNYSTARYNLGVTYLKKGNRDLALKQYQELEKIDEGFAIALKKEIDAKRR